MKLIKPSTTSPTRKNLPFLTISQENLTSLSPLELEQHLAVVYSYKFLQKTVLAAQSKTVVNTRWVACWQTGSMRVVICTTLFQVSYLFYMHAAIKSFILIFVGSGCGSEFPLCVFATQDHRWTPPPPVHTSTTNTAANTQINTMNNNAYTSRVLSITTLAMMLRYATILNPPTIRMRDEHIVVTTANLLNTSSVTTNTTRDRGNTANNAVDKIDVNLKILTPRVRWRFIAQEDPDCRYIFSALSM